MLPFTPDQFLTVFSKYNDAIWPAQIVAYLLGATAVTALFRRGDLSNRIILAVLAIMWAWTGIAYHLIFFATINKAAYAFGALFIVQAALLVHAGLSDRRIAFGLHPIPAAWVGAFFVLYAAILYPLLGIGTGHRYPELPMFGVTPCPVTIFTFGMLLLTSRPASIVLFVIPVLWSLIGGSAAILLGVPQDWLLLVSGILSVGFVVVRARKDMMA